MDVAPRVGAWIETLQSHRKKHTYVAPLAWGRGLKLCLVWCCSCAVSSPLAWGRGLKLVSLH